MLYYVIIGFIVKKHSLAKSNFEILTPSEPIMRAIIENMISPEYGPPKRSKDPPKNYRQGASPRYQYCCLDLVIWFASSANFIQIVRRQCYLARTSKGATIFQCFNYFSLFFRLLIVTAIIVLTLCFFQVLSERVQTSTKWSQIDHIGPSTRL